MKRLKRHYIQAIILLILNRWISPGRHTHTRYYIWMYMYKQLHLSVSTAVNPLLSMHLILWYILVTWIEHYTTKTLFKIQLKSVYQSTELLIPPRTYTPIQTWVIEYIIRYLIFNEKCRLEDCVIRLFQAGWGGSFPSRTSAFKILVLYPNSNASHCLNEKSTIILATDTTTAKTRKTKN